MIAELAKTYRVQPGLPIRRQIELAGSAVPDAQTGAATSERLNKTATPDAPKMRNRGAPVGRPLTDTVKSIVLSTEPASSPGVAKIWLLLLRGDHELNEVKTSKLPGFENGFRFATEEEIMTRVWLRARIPGPD